MRSLEYIKDYYKVPAEVGRRIEYKGEREGVIVAGQDQYIEVVFDGKKRTQSVTLHPTWEIKYLGKGKVPKYTRSQQRYARFKSLDLGISFAEYLGITK